MGRVRLQHSWKQPLSRGCSQERGRGRQRQVCPGSWCKWVKQTPSRVGWRRSAGMRRTIRSAPRRHAARWEPRERTGWARGGRQGRAVCAWAPGAQSAPPRAWASRPTTSEERGPPPAHRNEDRRAQLPSAQTEDAVFTETEQAEGGERQGCYRPSPCPEPGARCDWTQSPALSHCPQD